MRRYLFGLIALAIPLILGAPDRASAQGVFIGAGPVGVGVGVGPGWYGYGPYYGPYGYYAPYYGYGPTYGYGYAPRAYGYRSSAPRVYGYRSTTAPRVYGYAAMTAPAAPAAPAATAEPVRGPGRCETFFYWKDGRCMDARLKATP
jgi:hypothetical protein